MRKPRPYALAAVLALVLPAAAQAAKKPPPPPPPAVVVAPVIVKNVAPSYSEIGHVLAIQSVQVVPRVTAFIEAVPVKQGSTVKAGQVLFRLQKTQYQAALQTAVANLAAAQAVLKNAELAYERAARLSHQGFEAAANLDQALATRNQDQGNVLSAKANVTLAELNLGYCTITSPIAGRIGAVTLTKGNLVTPSTGALATVNQLDPIRVVFSVAERMLVSAKQKAGASQEQISDGLTVSVILSNGKKYSEPGKIAFLDNHVDPQTGTVSIYTNFSNPKRLLLPGAYVSVEVRQAKAKDQPLVPVAAVQTDKKGSFVLVVGSDNKVKQQPVSLGQQIAQNYVVQKGLSQGERVIIEGFQKVKPGQTVKPSTAPSNPPASSASSSSSGSSG